MLYYIKLSQYKYIQICSNCIFLNKYKNSQKKISLSVSSTCFVSVEYLDDL